MAHLSKYLSSAQNELDALPGDVQKRIASAVINLESNPRPHGCKKLKTLDAYCIRVGDYRVVYKVHDDVLIVLVIKVVHRGEVYR